MFCEDSIGLGCLQWCRRAKEEKGWGLARKQCKMNTKYVYACKALAADAEFIVE